MGFPLAARLSLFVALGASFSINSYAQDGAPPPAHIAVVDGTAMVETDRGIETAQVGLPLMPGDRVRTSSGRVEIVLGDGGALDLDEFTTFDLLSDSRLRLTAGRALLTVIGMPNPQSAPRYQVDMPVISARNEGPGEFRLGARRGSRGSEDEVAVVRGTATVTDDRDTVLLRAGDMILTRDDQLLGAVRVFNSARVDTFDQWTAARRDARMGSAASAQYLPDALRPYAGGLDQSGTWSYQASYGYVWYPSVAAAWRPYYNGYWTTVHPYGWTWIGADSWAWPTHHYGRWGHAGGRWFWVPGNHWGSAWVSWVSAPGYVGWSPLGYNNRPVFSFSFSVGTPWAAGWVVVPRAAFGVPYGHVRNYAVHAPNVPAYTSFVANPNPPVPGVLRGTRAVPRPGQSAAIPLPRQATPPALVDPNTASQSIRTAVPRTGGPNYPTRGDSGLTPSLTPPPPSGARVRTAAPRADQMSGQPVPSVPQTITPTPPMPPPRASTARPRDDATAGSVPERQVQPAPVVRQNTGARPSAPAAARGIPPAPTSPSPAPAAAASAQPRSPDPGAENSASGAAPPGARPRNRR